MSWNDRLSVVSKACNYHLYEHGDTHVICWLRMLQTLWLAVSWVHVYCNLLLYGAPTSMVAKLQRLQNSMARVVMQQPKKHMPSHSFVLSSLAAHRASHYVQDSCAHLQGTSHAIATIFEFYTFTSHHRNQNDAEVCIACAPGSSNDQNGLRNLRF